MHASVLLWVDDVVERYRLAELATLEVGSRDENGSVRPLFRGRYVGVDMRAGPGVDVVALARELPFADGEFETVVSTEMLEHDREFWRSLPEMGRVLRPRGLLLVTTRGNGFPAHAYPHDYFRFLPEAAPLLLELAGCEPLEQLPDPGAPGLFALGRRCA